MTKYFLGICSGAAQISAPTTISMLEIQRSLISRGHQLGYAIFSQADVAIARNSLASLFLRSDADVFIGIDDDTGLSAQAFETISASRHECLTVIVPRRDFDMSKFAARIRAGDSDAQAQLNAHPPIGLPAGQQEGFFEVEFGRTGMYMVSREVFERMMKPEITQQREARDGSLYWGFFDPGNDENGAYMSEDYSFFRRIKQTGTKIMAWYGKGVTHSGANTFSS